MASQHSTWPPAMQTLQQTLPAPEARTASETLPSGTWGSTPPGGLVGCCDWCLEAKLLADKKSCLYFRNRLFCSCGVHGSEAPSCLFLQDSNRPTRLSSSGLFSPHSATLTELVIFERPQQRQQMLLSQVAEEVDGWQYPEGQRERAMRLS